MSFAFFDTFIYGMKPHYQSVEKYKFWGTIIKYGKNKNEILIIRFILVKHNLQIISNSNLKSLNTAGGLFIGNGATDRSNN